jgi:hypothetical protein
MRRIVVIAFLAACGADGHDGGSDAGVDPDPLDITVTPAPGSLDDLHERIIAQRCSGQPGLCHNGQFEPNLSTPALTYEYLVNRPGLEKPDRLRAAPGNAAGSLIIDKLRNRNGVATQMPLGAEPLAEEDIQALEAWIEAGALRAPGAAPAPVLNNPPKRPEIAIFNTSGGRLDTAGPVSVAAGTTLVLRHSVQDFETPDAQIPFAAVILQAADGRNVVLNAGANDPHVGPTTFEAGAPMGTKDLLDFKRSFTIPTQLPLRDPATGAITNVAAAGQTLSVIAVYIDSTNAGIVAFDTSTSTIQIK